MLCSDDAATVTSALTSVTPEYCPKALAKKLSVCAASVTRIRYLWEFDERRHRIVIGDRHGIPIEQRTSAGVEELRVNLFVLVHAANATPRL